MEVKATLTDAQAWAFAEFLTRMTLFEYRQIADSKEDAFLMQQAGEVIRQDLKEKGYEPP